MEKLNKMYEAIEMLEALGMPVSGEQLRAVTDMEKEYLHEEVIPLIKQELEPLVSNMRNKFCIEIKYDKGAGLNVQIVEEKPSEDLFGQSERRGRNGARLKKFILRVVFPDGHVIANRVVADTLFEVVKYAGAERVRQLGITGIVGVNIVSDELLENERYRVGQKEVEPGLYVCTYSDTKTKLEQIKEINKRLNLGLQIEMVLL